MCNKWVTNGRTSHLCTIDLQLSSLRLYGSSLRYDHIVCKIAKMSRIQFYERMINVNFRFNFTTIFENQTKCHISIFRFWHFPPSFVQSKLTCHVTLFDHKLFLPKWTIIVIFYDFVSTQNVNAACFEWDFFFDFQTPCPFDPKIVRVCRKKSTLKRHLPMFSPCVRRVMTFSKCNDYQKRSRYFRLIHPILQVVKGR